MNSQRFIALLLVLGIVMIGGLLSAQVLQSKHMSDRLIVKFKQPFVDPTNVQSGVLTKKAVSSFDILNEKYGVVDVHDIGSRNPASEHYHTTYSLRFGESIDVETAIAEYSSTGLFEYVEEDGEAQAISSPIMPQGSAPNVQYFGRQWAFDNNGTFNATATNDADIDMPEAWQITTGDSSVIVAVIDAGLKFDHPSFAGRIHVNKADIPGNGIDDDSNGYMNDVVGWDFVDKDNLPIDDNGHGTFVTGVLAANGGDGGLYAGVDWKCKLMILKVLDRNSGTPFSRVAEAINYAVDNKARVINISIAGTVKNQAMQDAITAAHTAGVFVVCGMANNNNSTVFYPAACTNAFAVGSTNENDHRSGSTGSPTYSGNGGSNYGAHIKVVAPGNFIYGLIYVSDSNPDYFSWGTSLSTAFVSGLASLLLAQDPTRNADSLSSIITRTAEDRVGLASEDVAGWDKYYGYGRINAYAALSIKTNVVSNNTNLFTTNFNIYPNPAGSILYVYGLPSASVIFEVSDVAGRIVWSGAMNTMQSQIDLTRFTNGVYTIRESGGASQRFIIMH